MSTNRKTSYKNLRANQGVQVKVSGSVQKEKTDFKDTCQTKLHCPVWLVIIHRCKSTGRQLQNIAKSANTHILNTHRYI